MDLKVIGTIDNINSSEMKIMWKSCCVALQISYECAAVVSILT